MIGKSQAKTPIRNKKGQYVYDILPFFAYWNLKAFRNGFQLFGFGGK